MQLHIVSPLQTQTFDIAWIELNSDAGNFIIQSGHAPLLLVLAPGKEVVFRLKNGKEESITVAQALADITRERVTLIMNK